MNHSISRKMDMVKNVFLNNKRLEEHLISVEDWVLDNHSEIFIDEYYPERENCQNELEGERIAKEKEAQRQKEEDFGQSVLGRIRKFLWNLTEYSDIF